MAYPQSIAIYPQFFILNASFSILCPQIFLIQPHFSIFNSFSSIIIQKNGIFYSKSPQNSMISDKMFASVTCTAWPLCTCTSASGHSLPVILISYHYDIFYQALLLLKPSQMTPYHHAVLTPFLKDPF